MQSKKTNKKKSIKKEMRLDELLMEDRFDEEDDDSVTDDTLEFLCLDDEMIESYNDTGKSSRPASKASASRYEEDEEDEEDDYADEYEEEDDYADEYEDEEDDYEDEYEEDDDEEDDEYDDDRDGVIARFKYFLADMGTLDMLVAMLGIVVIAGVLVTGALFVNAKSIERQVEAFASVGEEIEGISVIGESGLLAVAESAKLPGVTELQEDEPEEIADVEEENQEREIEVTLNLTSIQSDLKIKFINKSTGKLISGVPFEVEVSSGSKTFGLKDDDKDGIIYQTGIDAGTYNVTVKPFSGSEYQEYRLPTSATSVKVSDTIAYKKVDVADEVKSEAEINAAAEDTAQQNTVVESQLQDTVEWVESTKTAINSDENYEEIKKDKIPDPATVSYAGTGFVKMVEGCICTAKCADRETANQECPVCKEKFEDCTPVESPEPECNCIDKCEGSPKEDCDVCKKDIGACEGTPKAPEKKECTCNPNSTKCTRDNRDPNCEACKKDSSVCKGKTEEPKPETPTYEVEITSCPGTLTVGTSGQALAQTKPSGGTITWKSSDSNIVAVESGTGKLTAKAVGTAKITATCESSGKSADATVRVENVKYSAISLSGNDKVTVNNTGKVSGTTTPGGGRITWESSDEKIVKIESQNETSATFKGLAAGTATITAKCGDARATWKVTVENIKYTAITLSGKNTLKVNEKITIDGKTTPEGGAVSWTSSDEKIAKIDSSNSTSAVVAGVAAGTATITAKCGDASATWKVTVENAKYTAITLSGKNALKVNEKITITGKTTPEGGAISWTSSDEKIAKIDSSDNTSAVVIGIKAGTATITAKCGDARETWKVTVALDNNTKLKDKNGKQIYIKKDGKFVEATYADYYTADKFYLQKNLYKYTGWQTIDGSVYFYDKDGNYVTGEQVIQGAKYTFGSDGKLSSGSGTMGIDVSKHNGNIDWNAVKNSGVSFVIIRCGYRGSATGVLVEDPMFRSNIKGAKAAGLKVGVYFFCQAVNEVEAVEEASMAVGLVSGYGLDMPIFLDVESAGGRGDQISRETRTAVCHAFCQTVQNSGYSAGIYANKTWFNEKINTGSLTGYKIWLAQYASAPTYTATRYDMWQYSSKGRISGISTDVDLDIRYY